MGILLSFLVLPTCLFFQALSTTAAAFDSGPKGIEAEEKVPSPPPASPDNIKSDSHTSFLSSAYIFDGIQNMTNVVQGFVAPGTLPDFWDGMKKYEKILQDYVPRLLEDAAAFFNSTKFTDISSSMYHIVSATAAFRSDIQHTLNTRNVTLNTLAEEVERAFMDIVHKLESIPPPDKAPSHAERTKMVDKVLDDVALALVNLTRRYGVDEAVVTTYLAAVRPQVRALTVVVGDINEQHPKLFSTLAFSIASLLIPESWILRPLLSLFGFGPSGPVKGSAAAFLQRYFWGAKVAPGSWFSILQAAGMGKMPKWVGLANKVPLLIGGISAVLSWFGRHKG